MPYVLLLGDTMEARRIGSRLRQSGHEVLTIPRREATTLVSQQALVLVITDTSLPETWSHDAATRVVDDDGAQIVLVLAALDDVAQVVSDLGGVPDGAASRAAHPGYDTRRPCAPEMRASRIAHDIAGVPRSHAAARWARAVVPIIESPEDPRTVPRWSRWIGASPGALRDWCEAARIKPRHSLVFGRLLRAIVLSDGGTDRPEDLLDVVDQRTLAGLRRLAGITGPDGLPRSVREFLDRQTLVRDASVLREVKLALEEYHLVASCAGHERS